MAKGKSNRGSAHGNPSSLAKLLTPKKLSSNYSLTPAGNFLATVVLGSNDRRRHRPDKSIRAPGAIVRSAARLTLKEARGAAKRHMKNILYPNFIPTRQQFKAPDNIALCVRRRVRREVLHATKIPYRSGALSGKKRRRNFWTGVSC